MRNGFQRMEIRFVERESKEWSVIVDMRYTLWPLQISNIFFCLVFSKIGSTQDEKYYTA